MMLKKYLKIAGLIISGMSAFSVQAMQSFENGFKCIQKLNGHTNAVSAVYYDYTQDYLTSCSYDKTVKIWDIKNSFTCIKTLTEHTPFSEHKGWVNSLFGTKDYLVSCSQYNIIIWNIKDNFKCIKNFLGHADVIMFGSCVFNAIYTVFCTPDYLFSGAWDTTIKIWDIKNNFKYIKTLTGHAGALRSLCGTSKYLVSGSDDGSIRIWDIKSNFECIKILKGHVGGIYTVFCTDDYIISGSTDTTIKIWDIKNNFKCIKTLTGHNGALRSLCGIGKYLVSGSDDGSIRIWDINNNFECVQILKEHAGAVRSLCWTGKYLVSGSDDKTIRIWKMSKPEASNNASQNTPLSNPIGNNPLSQTPSVIQSNTCISNVQNGIAPDNNIEETGGDYLWSVYPNPQPQG
jgi:WD40 repeat protein